jgi:hypothetical protein
MANLFQCELFRFIEERSPYMADVPYNPQDQPGESQALRAQVQNDSRTRLSESVFADRTAGNDRFVQAAETGDRGAFRADIANRTKALSAGLDAASDGMAHFNQAAQSGQLHYGTPEYDKAFHEAADGYTQAIRQAAGQLFQAGTDGKAQPSQMSQRVDQELNLVKQEMQALRSAADAGQQLTPEQMQKLGVTSADAKQAFREKAQQAMTLSDFQRSLGFAEANMGLAMIRATVSMPAEAKQAQIAEGEKLITAAGGVDGSTFKDPNFWQNYRYIYNKLGMQPPRDIPAGIDQAQAPEREHGTQVPGRRQSGIEQAAQPGLLPTPGDRSPTADQTAAQTQDTRYRLPYGSVRPDSPQFEDPHKLLADAESKLNGKLTPDDISRFGAAIQAADSLDRQFLKQTIDSEQAALKERALADQTGQLRLRVQAQSQLLDAIPKEDANIGVLRNSVAQHLSPDMQGKLAQLSQLSTTNQLRQFATQESATVNAIKQQPQGAELLKAIQERVANGERLTKLDGEIAQIDPSFAATQKDLNTNMRLYHSSIDTRAHALRAVMAHINEDPSNLTSARNLMLQMSQMDAGLRQRQDFMAQSRKLGITPDQLATNGPVAFPGQQQGDGRAPRQDVAQPGAVADTKENLTPPERAAALYQQVMEHVKQGKLITPAEEQAFEGFIQDASSINAQAVAAEGQRLDNLSKQLGHDTSVENRLVQMQKDASPSGQDALRRYAQQPDIQKYLEKRGEYETVVHGVKLAEAFYGLALLQGTNANDAQKKRIAGALITDANLDSYVQEQLQLNKVINAISNINPGTGRPGDQPPIRQSAETAEPDQTSIDPNDPRYALVPGLMNLERAALTLKQNQTNPLEALAQTQADFESALAASRQINPAQEATNANTLLPQLKSVVGELSAMSEQQRNADTTRLEHLQDLQNKVGAAAARAAEPTQVRMVYATTLNNAAVALYDQAKGDPSRAAELRSQADILNGKALTLLREIPQVDANYGIVDPEKRDLAKRTIDGEIQLAEQKKAITNNQGAAVGYAQSAANQVNRGLTFEGITGLQPLTALLNIGGPVVSIAGIPVPAATVQAAATQDQVRAQLSDGPTADAAVAQQQQKERDSWVHTAIDLVSGPGALYAAERIIPNLISKAAPAPVRLAAIGLGALGLDLGATFGLDKAAHATIGSDELSTSEWLSHSAASFGSSAFIRGAIGLRSTMASNALEQNATATALSKINPKLAASMNLTGETEAARASAALTDLKVARSEAEARFGTAQKSEYSWFNPQRQGSTATVTSEMRAASNAPDTLPAVGQRINYKDYMRNELGVDTGNKLAYLNPANMVAGTLQRTMPVGADGAFSGSVSDMAARQFWSKLGPTAITGGLATGLYGTGEVNPFVQNADGSQRYTWDQTVQSFKTNAEMGAIASGIAVPMIPMAGKFVGGIYKAPGQFLGWGARKLAPETTAKFMNTAPVAGVRNLYNGATEKVATGWDWLTNGSADLKTITSADASTRNVANMYMRAYAQPLALPISTAVTSAWAIGEWDRINNRSKAVAQAIRDHQN